MAGRRRPGAQARAPAPAPLSRPHSAAKAPSFDKAGITPKLGKGEMQVLRPYGFPLTRAMTLKGPQPSTPHGSAAAQRVSRAGLGHVTLKTPGLPVEARMFT